MIQFGFRPSPFDPRDWPLQRFGIKLGYGGPPERLDWLRYVDGIYSQNGPSCTGEGVGRAWNLRALIQGDSAAPYPDPLALYGQGRAREVDQTARENGLPIDPERPLPDEGAMLRHVLAAASECGVVPRGAWNDPTRTKRPDWSVIREGADRRVVQYARIYTPTDARIALAAGHPIVIGGPVDSSYCDYVDGVWDGCVGEIVGGHARCLVGYGVGYFIEVNSWGVYDGKNGLRHLSDRVVGTSELWAVELVTV